MKACVVKGWWVVVVALAFLAGCGGGDDGAGGGGSSSTFTIMLAADNEGIIYRIDADTGITIPLGASGIAGIRSMAYSAQASRFFAGTQWPGIVFYIDATLLSPTQLVLDTSAVLQSGNDYTGMTMDPASGLIYTVDESECSIIFAFDPVTGVAQMAADAAMPSCYSLNTGGIPLAANKAGMLYLIDTYNSAQDVYSINVTNDTNQFVGTYGYAGFPVPGSEGIVNDMAVRPDTQRVYVTTTAGYLGWLDFSGAPDMMVHYIATLPKALDGLTFATGEWPTLPQLPVALLAAGSTGKLYRVDTEMAATTLLGDTGVANIGSLAFVPQSGRLFAGDDTGMMYRVTSSLGANVFDLTPEAGTFVGGWYSGMAPDLNTGTVYVSNESECSNVFAMDPGSGSAQTVVDSGVPECYSLNAGGIPIGLDQDGNFYLVRTYSGDTSVYTVDVAGDTSLQLGTYTYAGFPVPGSEGIVNDMAVRPGDKRIFVTTTAGYLGWLDISAAPTLAVNYIGTLPEATDGLTFVSGALSTQ